MKALSDVSLSVRAGEIHAICGENGAGKSTLMKVLSGVYPYGTYSGEIVYEGEEVRFANIKQSEQAGIVIIHQELALIPELSITENLFLGNEPGRFGVIDWTAAQLRAQDLLARVGLADDPDTQIKNIGVGKQQLVEIAKALHKDVKLLILDEPTAALNENDSQHLLDLIVGLKAKGISSIIISHKLNEIEQIADEITIIRDGKTIETLNVKADGVNEDRIIRGMVGRSLESRFPDRTPKIGETFFEVRDWTVQHPLDSSRLVCKGSNFHVRRGEIVGFAGLMGAGRTELAMSLFGRSYGTWLDGQIIKDGREIKVTNVQQAIENGIGYVSEDRKALGLNLLDTVKRSTVAADLQEDLQGRRRRLARGVLGRREVPQDAPHEGAERRGQRRQALRWQPAEGRPVQVDVHRPGHPDPRRAHPRHRRGREVRDLRHHPAARGRGEGHHPHLLRAPRTPRSLRPDLHHLRGPDHR